ncbi:MAG: aminotransferase class I/II-fold pyridoxal phosphate-dependent enzyme, partial [Acetoanaerobium sp.]|nr:aminotransferase class I/II-fold pyridoxal phosphate-dependent enzyme [Acetoanaerobium sp.]
MISRRASEICPSKTIAISQKVNELKKSGFDIIDLSIGEPDFPIPSAAKKYVEVALKENKTKYDNVRGLEKLRDEVSKKLLNENFLNYSLAEIIISTGAKQPIYNSILATCDVGDEIIIPSPYWVSYIEIAKIAGVTPIIIETKVENEFKITANDLSSYINPKVKAILFSNPCNPTGSIYSKEELEEIAEVCLQNNILIISDEIYERIYYDVRPISIASISEAIKNITIVVNGFSKSCAMTG